MFATGQINNEGRGNNSPAKIPPGGNKVHSEVTQNRKTLMVQEI